MKCKEMLRMLNDYVDGDIDAAVCEEFEQHLSGCNPCQLVIDSMRKTITLYRDQEVYEVPGGFHERLHDALRKSWALRKK